jgi:membrane glycosyltransferase
VLPRALGVGVVAARGEAARHGGLARLLRAALLELLVSALLAPVRMLAHTGFVLSALTGWRLDWKSPARSALALPWREALARIGVLVLPALLLSLLLSGGDVLGDWRATPWLLPLLLAVPLTVFGAAPRRGSSSRSLLSLPEEREQPRVLARAADTLAFADLVPSPATPPAGSAARRIHRTHASLWLGVAFVTTVALAPRTALSPGLSTGWADDWPVAMELPTLDDAERALRPAVLRSDAPTARARVSRARPARMIDDAVRQRAADYVARALAES